MMDPILERRISPKAFLGRYILSGLIGVAVAAGFSAAGLFPLALLGALPPVGVFLLSRLARAGNRYRLFADRLEVESGLVSRRIENIELFRVRDVGLRQGLIGRMADYGDIYLHSTDSSTPDLHIQAVDAPKEVYEQLRSLISASRGRNRTVIVEQGNSIPES